MSSWLPDQVLDLLKENDGEQKTNNEDNADTIVLTVSPPSSRRPPPPKKVGSERRNYRNVPGDQPPHGHYGGGGGDDGYENHNRSLSPIASPKPTRKILRSLSQESPSVTQRKGRNLIKPKLYNRRPAPLKTKATSPVKVMIQSPEKFSNNVLHCSVDATSPSPKLLSVMVHLSEEAPMSPKVRPSSYVSRDPSLLGRMIRARKKAIPLNGFGFKVSNKHVKNDENGAAAAVKQKSIDSCIKEAIRIVPVFTKKDSTEMELEVDLAEVKWDYTSRPEILRQ